jgi:stage V sporulation protein G
MKITRVKITRIRPVGGMVAFADVVLDEQLLLSSIAIHEKRDGSGYRLTYPSKISGKFEFPIFHPISKELGLRIEEAITKKLKDVTDDADVRHRGNNAK